METEFLNYFEIKKTKGSISKFCGIINRNLLSTFVILEILLPSDFFPLLLPRQHKNIWELHNEDFHQKPESLGPDTYINHTGRPWPHAQGAEDSTAQLSLPDKVHTHVSLRTNTNDSTGKCTY